MPRFIITGAPGTGKTSVIDLLGGRYTTIPEPARELIAQHRAATGEATLDHRPELFVERLVARAMEDFYSIADSTVAIFDRGLPDCVAYANAFGVDPEPVLERAAGYRYESAVFVTPPWREIYTTDDLRRATFDQIEAFHAELIRVYDALEYEIIELPRESPALRAEVVIESIGATDA